MGASLVVEAGSKGSLHANRVLKSVQACIGKFMTFSHGRLLSPRDDTVFVVLCELGEEEAHQDLVQFVPVVSLCCVMDGLQAGYEGLQLHFLLSL